MMQPHAPARDAPVDPEPIRARLQQPLGRVPYRSGLAVEGWASVRLMDRRAAGLPRRVETPPR